MNNSKSNAEVQGTGSTFEDELNKEFTEFVAGMEANHENPEYLRDEIKKLLDKQGYLLVKLIGKAVELEYSKRKNVKLSKDYKALEEKYKALEEKLSKN